MSCIARGPRASSSSTGGHFLLLHLTTRSGSSARPPAGAPPAGPVGEAHLDLSAPASRPDHRLVHLGGHSAGADLEGVRLARRAARRPRGEDRSRPPRSRRPGPGGRASRASPAARRARRASLDVGVRHRAGRVLDRHPPVLAERDRRLDLDDRGEAERPPSSSRKLPEVGSSTGGRRASSTAAAVDRRDQRLGHRLAHLVRERESGRAATAPCPGGTRQPGRPAGRGRTPPSRPPHFLLGGLDDQLTLTRIELLNSTFIRWTVPLREVWWREGELNPQGIRPLDPKSSASASSATLARPGRRGGRTAPAPCAYSY